MATRLSTAPVKFRRHMLGILMAASAAAALYALATMILVTNTRGFHPFAPVLFAWIVMFMIAGFGSLLAYTVAWPLTRHLRAGALTASLVVSFTMQALGLWADHLVGRPSPDVEAMLLGGAIAVVIGVT